MTNSPIKTDSQAPQRKRVLIDSFRVVNWPIVVLTTVLCIVGWLLFRQFADYQYLSDRHVADIMRAKFWSIAWLLISFGVVYWKRHSPLAPALAVLAVSAYFVVLYGILFRGTEYGMNGHWGDNGNRLAAICKMMAYNTLFTDWYLKDLPSFYPPGWFALMVIYAKVLGIEAYQTIKWGYLLVFLTYPWLLYFAWRKLVSPIAAAAVAVGTLFFAYRLIDWIYYEHMCAALFMPWWLYYFERVGKTGQVSLRDWKFYLAGAVFGGLMFMTYYYWFFMAAAAMPITLVALYVRTKSLRAVWQDIVHKVVLMGGVAVISAVYWLPLLRVIYWEGAESAQNAWFGLHHSNLALGWESVSIGAILIYAGLFFCLYFHRIWKQSNLVCFFLGGLVLIMADRLTNTSQWSLQTRKVLEFVHVFAIAPLGIGLAKTWSYITDRTDLAKALVGVLLLTSLIIANEHTEMHKTGFYRIAINQRVPEADLDVFRTVTTAGKVILTPNYRESCYLPYYLFIPYNNMTSHTAGRYSQRELFLDQAAKINDPQLLAYVLAHNRYSPIDYVYMPIDKQTGRLQIKLYQVTFMDTAGKMKIITMAADHTLTPDVFVKRHERGMFELLAADRSAEVDHIIQQQYPDIYWHLTPVKW